MFEKLKSFFSGNTAGSNQERDEKIQKRPAKKHIPASASRVHLQYQFAFENKTELTADGQKDLTGRSYQVHGREYTDISSFQNEKEVVYTPDIVTYKDIYGYPVLALYQAVNAGEGVDAEWNSLHALYLVYDGTDVFGVYCEQGYGISKLVLYEKLLYAEREVKELFGVLEFPLEMLDAFELDDPQR